MLVNILILALATWRISSLIKDEDGPYEMFSRFRTSIGLLEHYQFDSNGEQERILLSNGSFLADVVQCFWCLSIWIGYGIAFLAALCHLISWQEFIFVGVALSAIAIIIEEKVF